MRPLRTIARTATVVAIALVLVEGVAFGVAVEPAGAVQASSREPAGIGASSGSPDESPVRAPALLGGSAPEAPRGSLTGSAALGRADRSVPHLLVRVERAVALTARPGGGRVVGTMPRGSRYYGTPHVAWALELSDDGRFARFAVPYAGRPATGWLRIADRRTSSTRVSVIADLSEHRIVVRRGDRVLFRAPAATGAPGSPTPTGRFFVTDRVPFPSGGVLGTFAFGISGIQTRLPAGWKGGDQLAIHGTDAPSTIGRSASAGCLRVSERVLERLRPLLQLGTPVIIRT